MHAIAMLFVLLTITTQAVLCFFNSVNYSTPEQCGPFVVNFSGSSDPPVLPLALSIVPIYGNPIQILLPMDSWDNSSNAGTARITFLPLSSGTQFVASLDDGTGAGVGLVSDVIAVKHSNVTTCLAPVLNQKGTDFYHMHGDLSQCSRFNVTFDPSIIQRAPSIRAFLPRSFSFSINATDDPVRTITLGQHNNSSHKDRKRDGGGGSRNNGVNGNNYNDGIHTLSSKEYLLNIIHGFQAVLTLDDGDGHRESSKLFTAGGTSSSSSNCFKESLYLPSRTPDASSSASREAGNGLSRTGKIIVSVLGVGVALSLAVILYILRRRRRGAKRDLEKTSFVFTEDVDMGSSFVSRMRARISHLTSGRRSFRSYRSYRDERDGASTYVPTSPIGSPALQIERNVPLPQAEKSSSWVEINAAIETCVRPVSESFACEAQILKDAEEHGSVIFPIIEFNSFAPFYEPDAYNRSLKPDVPIPAASRSSESSRFLLGSGYLSSRSSGAGTVAQNGGLKTSINRLSVPLPIVNATRAHPYSAIALSADISSLGYVPSRSSSATAESRDNGIYVSSPVRPSPDPLDGVSPQPDADEIRRPSTPVARDSVRVSRHSIFKGNLRRDGVWRERGRILPFPTTSLRTSRSSQQ